MPRARIVIGRSNSAAAPTRMTREACSTYATTILRRLGATMTPPSPSIRVTRISVTVGGSRRCACSGPTKGRPTFRLRAPPIPVSQRSTKVTVLRRDLRLPRLRVAFSLTLTCGKGPMPSGLDGRDDPTARPFAPASFFPVHPHAAVGARGVFEEWRYGYRRSEVVQHGQGFWLHRL